MRGCCAVCGYDLRGNTSGICPECGEAVENIKSKIKGIALDHHLE